ncbi:glycoside hydrolase family 3 N-terminal domain-containing protein [Aeromonas caviae]|uniref:glycoside hydrolase family 3 protein n=1 Tax=Aeromonas caviae TaxID=648 RepID=UPI0038CF82D4
MTCLFVGCGIWSAGMADELSTMPYFSTWPQIHSAIARDEGMERQIQALLSRMTLEEKVGQMIQPDFREVTPEEVTRYKIGSVLNGGGGWPGNNKHASAQDWAHQADTYWQAAEAGFEGRGYRIPFMWATDAVHGHNNVFAATLFPHNIGLGAARDPDLIYRIGQVTAREVAATGLDWTFAPTVAVPRDDRWGRTYEGYSEDPAIVYHYAGEMVRGLQGSATDLRGQRHVISNVKHFVGDGGTLNGVDRGQNFYSEEDLRNLHAVGYFSGLDAGAQVVMASFNSWHNELNRDVLPEDGVEYNGKLHGSRYLLTDVLKGKMGFDGLVVSDWNGHSEIAGCTMGSCLPAVLAGVDIFMVTARKDWMEFRQSLLDGVASRQIPISRIDDAVTRILRVKMRAGLWEKPMPSARELAGKQGELGAVTHKALAREAVRKSLVLLKNEGRILPLSRQSRVLVAGSAANDLGKQVGGWSLTWQGSENGRGDFPGAQSVLDAVTATVGADHVQVSTGSGEFAGAKPDVAILVMGEDPYAEWFGDIPDNKTLAYGDLKSSYHEDLLTLKRLKAAGIPVVTVLFSGRPLYVNEELNLSSAFVAAWLPGTEGEGITDLLFRDAKGKVAHDFQGRLSFSWPFSKCATTINHTPTHIPGWQRPAFEQDPAGEYAPLFPYGYGLSYGKPSPVAARVSNLNTLTLDNRTFGCNESDPAKLSAADKVLELFGPKAGEEHRLRMGDASNWTGTEVSGNSVTEMTFIKVQPIDYLRQQDARAVTFLGTDKPGIDSGATIQLQTTQVKGADRRTYLKGESELQVTLRVQQAPAGDMTLGLQCGWPCGKSIEIAPTLRQLPPQKWVTLSLPLRCLEEGMDFAKVNTPFILGTSGQARIDMATVRWVPASLLGASGEVVRLDCQGRLSR